MDKYCVFDAHCDTLSAIVDFGGDFRKNVYNADRERMEKYRDYTQLFACFISPEHKDRAWERFFNLKNCFDAQEFGEVRAIMSVEGAEMITDIGDVKRLADYGVRALSLTWNGSNQLAGGADDDKSGLTDLGKAVIKELEKNNIIFDVSHLNDKSFFQATEIITRPIIASHSNSRTICNHRRNLTDEMFKTICNSGGCVGINLYPPFVSQTDECTINDVISHIEYFLELGGENCIGIGADFDGTENLFPNGIEGSQSLYKIFDTFIRRGYSNELIEKISHRNFERVFFGGEENA